MIQDKDILTIKLNATEMSMCESLARDKFEWSRKKGHSTIQGVPNGSPEYMVLGMQGELAASLALCMPWNTKPAQADLGSFIEVRTIGRQGHRLAVRADGGDDFDRAYVLVHGWERPTFKIVGWQWGHEIKKSGQFLDKGDRPGCTRAAYYLYYNQLKPIWDLLNIAEEKGERKVTPKEWPRGAAKR